MRAWTVPYNRGPIADTDELSVLPDSTKLGAADPAGLAEGG